MSKEAMKLALEGAANYIDALGGDSRKYRQALADQPAQQGCMRCNTPKKCALYGCSPLTWPSEQPAQQEPVALGYMNAGHVHEMQQGRLPYGYVYPKGGAGANVAIYTSPPAQRTWVGLTDEETGHWAADFLAGAKWAEAKLKEKNNG